MAGVLGGGWLGFSGHNNRVFWEGGGVWQGGKVVSYEGGRHVQGRADGCVGQDNRARR